MFIYSLDTFNNHIPLMEWILLLLSILFGILGTYIPFHSLYWLFVLSLLLGSCFFFGRRKTIPIV